MEKIQVYYQPEKNSGNIKSLSISYYDFNEKELTYRHKITLERDDGKYKIKGYYGSLPAILPLRKITLSDRPHHEVDKNLAYFYVKTEVEEYLTNDRKDIEDILNFIHFDEVLNYDISKYKKER